MNRQHMVLTQMVLRPVMSLPIIPRPCRMTRIAKRRFCHVFRRGVGASPKKSPNPWLSCAATWQNSFTAKFLSLTASGYQDNQTVLDSFTHWRDSLECCIASTTLCTSWASRKSGLAVPSPAWASSNSATSTTFKSLNPR